MENQALLTKSLADGSIIISSGERLTIENAADFSGCIREALAASPRVAVEFAAHVEVDLTTLQVLCSACKTAAAEGKSFSPQGTGSDAINHLLTASGAGRPGGCRHSNGNPCIWFGGND